MQLGADCDNKVGVKCPTMSDWLRPGYVVLKKTKKTRTSQLLSGYFPKADNCLLKSSART